MAESLSQLIAGLVAIGADSATVLAEVAYVAAAAVNASVTVRGR
jgi:hypothetical protein